jgi:hypothetical protein
MLTLLQGRRNAQRERSEAKRVRLETFSAKISRRRRSSMQLEILVTLGGIFNIVFVIFHLFFWKIFNWKRDLKSLSFINRQVMQVLNLCLTFAFLIFAYVSLCHTVELLGTELGHSILALIGLFWFLRALEQVLFFGLNRPLSIAFFLTFLFGAFLYAYPWFVSHSAANAS